MMDEPVNDRYSDDQEKGREEGREEGERNLFKQIIQRRYDVDVLPAWAEQAVNAASKAQIESWTRKSFDTSSLEDLLK
ncbi:hypothetical protein MNBD_GAMMA13-1059 [hydrothermal vent metagenome]|uniref:DUF4351 domain-containing protein n=1 Tax=hydrothermal vent metagenome TaxID=652676 RepID=A0A3B0YWK6_9ZZZZ